MTDTASFFALLRMEACGEDLGALPLESLARQADGLYALSEKHDLAHIVGSGLLRRGVLTGTEAEPKFRRAVDQAMSRYLRMDYEYERICAILEEAQIHYIPLKGAVLRGLYPEPWMRTSCDIDILVREESLDAAIGALTGKLGYENKGRSYHDVSLFSPAGVHLELHFDALENGRLSPECIQVLAGIWEDAVPVSEGMYRLRMSDEMFYFYHMAHMAMHFVSGGCGIKQFLDVWILNHRVSFDAQKRQALLSRGQLMTFTQAVERAAEVWFSGETSDALTQRLCEFVLGAGAYGTALGKAAVQQTKQGGKKRYMLSNRIFMPYEAMKSRYPVLKDHRWLLPAYQVVRWTELLKNGRAKNALVELRANSKVVTEDTAEVVSLLEDMGLNG